MVMCYFFNDLSLKHVAKETQRKKKEQKGENRNVVGETM